MATTYELKTFADIVAAVREELQIQAADTTSINRIKRNINTVYLQQVCPQRKWKWLQRSRDLTVPAAITTGTATVTQGSVSVTLSSAPAASVLWYWFSIDGQEERYKIARHAPAATAVYLDVPYLGESGSDLSYTIWPGYVELPSECEDLLSVSHDFLSVPLDEYSLQDYRRITSANPKLEGRPQCYYVKDYEDQLITGYSTPSTTPSRTHRSSAHYERTLTFATSVEGIFFVGDQIRITAAGDYRYNGIFVVNEVSSTSLTYTAPIRFDESSTADTGTTIARFVNKAFEGSYRQLAVHPSIYSESTVLHLDYEIQARPLTEDTDEPLIPREDRSILLYGALDSSWVRERNPEAADRNYAKYQDKLSKMSAKSDSTASSMRLKVAPDYLYEVRNRRRRFSDDE